MESYIVMVEMEVEPHLAATQGVETCSEKVESVVLKVWREEMMEPCFGCE